jgi:hypothetical protein
VENSNESVRGVIKVGEALFWSAVPQKEMVMYLQCIYGQKPSKHSRDNLKCEVQVNPSFGGSLLKIGSARCGCKDKWTIQYAI